jgi:Arc/MetJ-type ribon-helix-helix transcriptional regulator
MSDPGATILTLALPAELVAVLRARVAAGDFPDESAGVAQALRLAFDEDAALEAFLREAVVAAHAEHRADPEAAIPVEAVMDRLRALHEARQTGA